MQNWWNKIGTRLVAFFSLVIFMPALMLSVFTYVHEKDSLYEAAVRQLESVATLKERAIKSWLVEVKELIKLLSSEPYLNKLAVELLNLNESDPRFKDTFDELQKYLWRISLDKPTFVRISVLSNVGGQEIVSTDNNYVGRYHLADSFFTLGKKGTYVQKVVYSKELNETIMIVATPIITDQGEQLGVLYAVLDPNWLTSLMRENSGLGDSGETYLVDVRRHLVSSEKNTLLNRAMSSQGIDLAFEQQEGIGVYENYAGVPVLGSYRWLEETHVALLSEMSEEEVFLPLVRFTIHLAFSTLAIISFSFLLALVLSRKLSRPIVEVTRKAQMIAKGDLSQDVPVLSRGEIGDLSESFNVMAGSLRESMSAKEEAMSQLEKNNEELMLATSAKNMFLANMSHELRTPLNAVIGYSELLRDDAQDKGNLEYVQDLEQIHASGLHLLDLVSDILDVARIEEGKLNMRKEAFDVGELIREIMFMISPMADKNHNRLEVHCDKDIGEMRGDMMRVRQVLLNILNNACKFTEGGFVRLVVSRQEDAAGQWINFEVEDSGIGIEKEKLDTVFEEFIQADITSTRKYGGAGLGLTIVEQLVTLMGGEISVKSTPGVGSHFYVKLPF